MTRAVSLSLRGVDEYDDPVVGHRVELPTGWPTAWSDGQGGYILSADPSFDPNGATATETWQRIRRLRE